MKGPDRESLNMRHRRPVPYEYPNARIARFFRAAGPLLFAVGAILIIVAFVDLISASNSVHRSSNSFPAPFSSSSSNNHPDKFFLGFIGIPLAAAGGWMIRAGYMRRVAEYKVSELAPVASDAINYVAAETEDTVRSLSRAVNEELGIRGKGAKEPGIRCHKCNATNEANSKFCDQCGAALEKSKPCGQCGELNDPDAKFCDECGATI